MRVFYGKNDAQNRDVSIRRKLEIDLQKLSIDLSKNSFSSVDL